MNTTNLWRAARCALGGLLLASGLLTHAHAQTQTYTSPVSLSSNGISRAAMVQMNYKSQFQLNADRSGGIIATVNPGGRVELRVFAYDQTKSNGRGPEVYYSYSDQTSTTYVEKSTQIATGTYYQDGVLPAYTYVASNNLKERAFQGGVYNLSGDQDSCKEYVKNLTVEGWFLSIATLGIGYLLLPSSCEAYYHANQPVVVEVKVTNATVTGLKVPGVGALDLCNFFNGLQNCDLYQRTQVFKSPNQYPNYVMIAAHRGYWQRAPENSMQAFKDAIAFGVDMVEIDVRKTADDSIVVAHDIHLGRLTTVPTQTNQSQYQQGGSVRIAKLPLSKIRPDLYGNIIDQPVMLLGHNGQPAEKMPTLREVLLACKGKVLVDIDKIEGFYYQVYKIAQETGTLDQVVVKGRYEYPSELKDPANVPNTGAIDWTKLMFTPVYFDDLTNKSGQKMNLQASINAFLTDPTINCPGVELIYRNESDSLLTTFYSLIKSKNKQVMQFPQFPETVAGVYNPKQFLYSDVDPRTDKRNDWDWLLNQARTPSLIISDRLEVLVQLMQQMGLRNK